MAEIKSTTDYLSQDEVAPATLPSSLNVLTILTLVGCGLGLFGAFWSYIKADESYKKIQEAQANMADAPGWAKGMMGPEMLEMARKSAENKLPILLLTLLGVGLCAWGAIEMRKLKKQGFIIWVAGEFLPLLGSIALIGFGMFSGFAAIGLLFPIIFLILYAVNKKHLVY